MNQMEDVGFITKGRFLCFAVTVLPRSLNILTQREGPANPGLQASLVPRRHRHSDVGSNGSVSSPGGQPLEGAQKPSRPSCFAGGETEAQKGLAVPGDTAPWCHPPSPVPCPGGLPPPATTFTPALQPGRGVTHKQGAPNAHFPGQLVIGTRVLRAGQSPWGPAASFSRRDL